MSKTIKQIAEEIGVSKPTISRVIFDLGIEPHKVGNRFELSDDDITLIKTQISQNGETIQSPKSQHEKSQQTQHKTEKSLISLLETQITLLQTTIDTLQGQLNEKDAQIRGQQEQITALQAELALERQHSRAFTDNVGESLRQLTMGQTADKAKLLVDTMQQAPTERKLSFWERRAAKKAEKKARKENKNG